MKAFGILISAVLVALTALVTTAAPASAGATLDAVKKRGELNCGVNTGLAGFSIADAKGHWSGIDADTCRAIAAAVLGDPNKVRFIPHNAEQRFPSLQTGEVDVLARNTTWTLTREASLGLLFAPPTYYDGQGFMVAKKLGVTSAMQLNGATICVQPGTTTELNLSDYFRKNGMAYKTVVIEKVEENIAAFTAGRCDVMTTDSSQLAAIRATALANPDDYVILPERVSKEPLGPMVRQGDDQWYQVVKWTLMGMKEAEELGITSQNVDQMLKSEDPAIKRDLGVTEGFGKGLGLDEKWLYHVIKQVGNYGESFERNLGAGSKIRLDRGLNDVWTRGGLMYALPLR